MLKCLEICFKQEFRWKFRENSQKCWNSIFNFSFASFLLCVHEFMKCFLYLQTLFTKQWGLIRKYKIITWKIQLILKLTLRKSLTRTKVQATAQSVNYGRVRVKTENKLFMLLVTMQAGSLLHDNGGGTCKWRLTCFSYY